jgi:hypothetical protein
MVLSHVDLRTIQGDVLTMTLPTASPTAADVIQALRKEPYNYAPGVALMFAGKVIESHRDVNAFPAGHVVIAGHPMQAPPAQGASHHTGGHQQQTHHHHQHQQQSQPQQAQSPTSQRGPGPQPTVPPTSPVPERGSTVLNLKVQIPADNSSIAISVADNATVMQAVQACGAIRKDLANCRLIFRGKVLNERPNNELKSFGVHDGMTLHAISGTVNPLAVHLAEIKADFNTLKVPCFDVSGQFQKLDDRRRNLFYEDSMKLLYRLDNLEGLPDDLRAERKALVKEIQQLQDSLQQQ